jgi:hypothetical protein
MASSNVDFWASHARSGHSLPTNQERYWDRDDIYSSLTAAKCLAGWSDFYAQVLLSLLVSSLKFNFISHAFGTFSGVTSNLRCLDVSDALIDKLISSSSSTA